MQAFSLENMWFPGGGWCVKRREWQKLMYPNISPKKYIFLLHSDENMTVSYVFIIFFRGPRHFKFASSIVLVFLFTSWVATFIIAYQYNYEARIEEPFTLFDQLYDKPWMRVGPYLIGMMTGWLLFRINSKLKLPGALVTACWFGCIAILMSLVYGLGKDGLQVPLSAFYVSCGNWIDWVLWDDFYCGAVRNYLNNFFSTMVARL